MVLTLKCGVQAWNYFFKILSEFCFYFAIVLVRAIIVCYMQVRPPHQYFPFEIVPFWFILQNTLGSGNVLQEKQVLNREGNVCIFRNAWITCISRITVLHSSETKFMSNLLDNKQAKMIMSQGNMTEAFKYSCLANLFNALDRILMFISFSQELLKSL